MQLKVTFSTHHAFHYSYTSNVESLNEATKKHVQSLYLNCMEHWHMHNSNNHTTSHLPPVFVQERVPRKRKNKSKSWSVKWQIQYSWLHIHTMYIYTAWSSPFDIHYNPMNLLKSSIHLSLSYVHYPTMFYTSNFMNAIH